MKNRGWRNRRDQIRKGRRRRRKAKRARESLRVVEPEDVEEEPEEQPDPQPENDRIVFIRGIAERKQKRRFELQKKI